MSLERKPLVVLVGGNDIEARIPLASHLARDFDFLLYRGLQAGAPIEPTANAGIGVRDYQLRSRWGAVSPLGLLRLRREVRQSGASLVHTFDTLPNIFARLALVLAGIPVVGTVTGRGRVVSSAAPLKVAYWVLMLLSCRAAALTVFQNDSDLAWFVRYRICSPVRVRLIRGSGIDIDHYLRPRSLPDDENNQLGLSLPDGSRPDLIVVMISRLLRQKGVVEFGLAAELAAKGRSAGQSMLWILVGAPASGRNAVDPADLMRRCPNLLYLGAVEDVRPILHAADIFVLPTGYGEGVPRVLLEAAAVGVPIITTRVPGAADVIAGGTAGVILESRCPAKIYEAVESLAADADGRVCIANRAKAVLEGYRLETVVAQTQDLYTECLEGIRG